VIDGLARETDAPEIPAAKHAGQAGLVICLENLQKDYLETLQTGLRDRFESGCPQILLLVREDKNSLVVLPADHFNRLAEMAADLEPQLSLSQLVEWTRKRF